MTGLSHRLDDQVAVITGAGRGIGAATARALAAAGALTVITARSGEELDAVAREIRAAGGAAEVVPGDLADHAFVDELFDGVQERHGRLDVLVNNAGTAWFAPIAQVTPERWASMLALNTVAPYACMRRALGIMRAGSDDGRIVNVSSVEAYWTAFGDCGAYPASKFALRAMSQGVAKELKQAGSGVRVCMLSLGGVNTTLVNPSGEPNPIMLDPAVAAQAVLNAVAVGPDVHVFDTVVMAQPFFTF